MKLVTQFENKYNKITYSLYELDCGIKLIYLKNPATINFDFYALHQAGCIYEDSENVPHGTAHLTEHIINKPNNTFATLDDIQKFTEGNKKRPSVHTNAGTWFKHLDLRGSSNIKGASRVVERLDSILEFPYSKFKEALVNEKRIVIAERSRRPKLEKDNFIQKMIFLQGDIYPEFTYNIIGEVEDIKKIDIDDLQKYFVNRILNKGSIFSIQSNQSLDPNIIRKIEKMGQKYVNDGNLRLPQKELTNMLGFGYFFDEKATGTTLDLAYFSPTKGQFDYKKDAIENILNSVIKRIGYLLLREEKGLIYSLQTIKDDTFTMYHDIKYMRFVVENSRIGEMFKSLEPFLLKEIKTFINSEQGTRWINNFVSNYIFPTTIVYDQELGYNIAMDYLEYNEIYNYNLYVDEIKKVSKEDLTKKLDELLGIPPHIWIESNLPKEEIEKITKHSSLWKRYSK